MGWGICFVALDERFDGGRLWGRHFSYGIEGLRKEAGGCSVHLIFQVLDGNINLLFI